MKPLSLDCRLVVYSFLDSSELLTKIACLDRQTRGHLMNKRSIFSNRELTLHGLPPQSLTSYASSLTETLIFDDDPGSQEQLPCEVPTVTNFSVRSLELRLPCPLDLSKIVFANMTDLFTNDKVILAGGSLQKLERAIIQDLDLFE